MDIKKLLVIFAFLLFLVISPCFANDNATDVPIGSSYGDVYFNASSLSDGDGSIENPYNKITMDRINNYATLHLADGEYNVSGFKTISSLSIVGESYDKTIVRHDGLLFTVLSELSLNNLTLSGVTIKNQGLINSTNVIFSDSVGSSSDGYNNVFGGVFDNLGTRYVTPTLCLDNCIFRNNHAEYGGAIYLINSNAFIYNCLFEKNIAYNYGGAIACDGTSRLTIKNTLFKFDSSTNDAGGALYLKNSSINIENSNFTNCDSTFGGAICDLNSELSLYNVICSSNNAVYDGGAIFKMYGSLSVLDSKFNFNTANNGGAIFADNSSSFIVQSSRFSSNNANNYGGAIYSILNNNSGLESNIYTRNKAKYYPNTFKTDSVNMFIGNNNYSMFKYNNFNESDLPVRYSLLDDGYVTPVKDQQASGNCWAFTAIAALESCILKASNITYDLSEENMKNLIELYSDYGWNMDTNDGGYDNMALGYLASWLGPVLEENDLFDDYSTLSPILDSIIHIQNVMFLGRESYTDNSRIKEAILKYGAVGTGIYYSGSYLFGDAYYYSGTESENHAVTIVGWDDDYPYYKFGNQAPANGAWIVKNSWMDNWADKGYFYVSYYDTRFARVGNPISSYTFILNDTLRYDKNYQYDFIGLTKFLSTANNEVWYENVFNSTEDEVLAAFSTYFYTKTNWTSYVFVNDEYVFKQNGTALPGYYTFDFDDHIYLNQGDSFKIIVKLENNFASAPLSEKIYSNKVFSKKGISFLSYDGKEWYDLYTYENSPVVCLKAFTITPSISLKIKDIGEIHVDEFFNITSFTSDNKINGSVVYNISGMIFAVNMTDGVANLPISFNKSGNYEGSAYFVCKDKFSNKVNFTIKIIDKNLDTFIKLDNITSEVDKIILVNATICDENNQLVSQGNLTLTVGNDTYVCPVENGSAVCEISFEMPGNYVVAASFNGINYNPSSKIINVKVNKLKLKSNVTLNNSIVYVGDEIKIISNVLSGNLTVDGGFAVFSINNTEYKINVSNNNAVLDVVFNQSGRYIVDVSFSHEKYDIDGCSLVVDVSDRFSRVSISDLKVYVGEKCNVSAIVFDENGEIIKTGFLSFKICGEIYNIDLSGDSPVLEITFNEIGCYDVFVEFDAFGYQKSFNSSVIDVSKRVLDVNFILQIGDITLNATQKTANLTCDVDKIIFVNATICDENNQLVSQGNLTLTVGNDTYVCPVENGSAVCEISFEMPGNYVVVASFNGINYNPSSKSINVKVNKLKLKSNVTLNNSIVYVGDEIKFISNVLSDNLTVDGGFAVFSINNAEYKINVSKNNAVLDDVFNQSGRYIVDVSFSHEKYDIDGCSLVVDVSDRFSRVSISDLKVYVGEKCNVSALVFDENGEIIKTGFLIFNIRDEIYNIDLSSDSPVLEIIFNETGCYDVLVEFYAFGYQKSSNSSVIDVSKRVLDVNFLLQIGDITLNATQKTAELTCDVDKIIFVNAVICDENNQLVSQGNLTLTVGNDTYVCPVENGSAVCEISFEMPGNYVVAASFNGINYNPSSKSINVKVNKLKLKSNVTLNNSIVYTGDEIKFISNVLSDNLTVDGGFVLFSINTTEYNVNISNNKAILDVKFNQSGNYIVNVRFSHEKYDIDGCSLVVDVSDRFSRVSISDLKVYVGEKCNVSALVFDENGEIIKTGFLIFNIRDEIYNIDLSSDSPVLEIIFNETGCYDVLVEFYAFGYQKSSNSSVIEVSKKNLKINFTIDDIYYGDDLIIKISSDDVVGVETVINNVKYNLKTNAEFKIEDILNAGNYDAILIFNGSDIYNSFNKTTNFTVKKLSLSANFKVENKTLFIQFSHPIKDTLSLKINNQNYIVNLTEGKSELDLSNLSIGNYLLVVNYTNPNYDDVLKNYSFTIPKINTRILVQDLIKYYKSASRYELTIIDEKGNYLSNKDVIISLANVNYRRTTDEYGKASIGINLNSGTYSALIYFEGDEQYNSSKNSSIIIVKSTIVSNNLIKCYKNASQFYATILDHDGNLVKNKAITFNINGVFYNRTTNEKGVVKLNINLVPGDYIITTENLVTGERASNNITVISLIVENNNLVKYYRNDSQYSVKILGDDGNPVGAGENVRFNINGVFYERRTNEFGIAKLNINLNPGVYIITAEYNGCRVSNNIKVIPILTANDLTKDYGASDQFVATLVDGKGNPYAKQYVEFNINGVFYQRITDDNGQAKLNIRLMPGKYIITSAFGTFQTSNTIMIR